MFYQSIFIGIYILLFFRNEISALEASNPFYQEHLFLKPLPLNHLLASFRFNTSSDAKNNYSTFGSHSASLNAFSPHLSRLPRSLRNIMEQTHTYEIHLRMTRGKWDYKHWGMQIDKGEASGGAGIELWAYIEGDNMKIVEERWKILINSFSGLFCASINFLDATKMILPILSFAKDRRRVETYFPNAKGHILHGSLPQEAICTENLTPFLKLLPCKGRAGISTLIDSHRLFDAPWYSIFLDIKYDPNMDTNVSSSLIQGIDMVLNIERASRRDVSPIPIPKPLDQITCDNTKDHIKNESCFPLEDHSDIEWSLSKVFGQAIKGSCSLDFEQNETITIIHSNERELFPKPDVILVQKNEIHSKYKISASPFDIKMMPYPSNTRIEITDAPLFVERSITRKNQINVLLSNRQSKELQIVYLESLPWFMKPYIHTLNAYLLLLGTKSSLNFEETYFRSSIDRKRGSYFEARIIIPANASVEITWEFEKLPLRYTEYPPDPNRGFNIAPSIITVFNSKESIDQVEPIALIRTTSLLLTFPTPDFSMPYNVIVLTSTVIAMLFGGMFNLLIRRFITFEEAKKRRFLTIKLNIIIFKIKSILKKRLIYET